MVISATQVQNSKKESNKRIISIGSLLDIILSDLSFCFLTKLILLLLVGSHM
jgi:hypothetical protein